MGEVYLAHDTKLDRKVALKILPADLYRSANEPVDPNSDRVRRFVQEAKAASALNHPNILTIYEVDEVDSEQFIATEYIDGETLRERIRTAPLTPGEAIELGIQIASALDATHNVGIIHRDIKPENIMLRRDGLVKILDFGLAKLARDRPAAEQTNSQAPTQAPLVNTEVGIVLGTAPYMSPEQARGLEVDARTDIWSLGCVLYEMVTARQPFVGQTTLDVLSGVLNCEPDSLMHHLPDGPSQFERIVFRSLRKECEHRYQTAKEMLSDLKELKSQLEVDSRKVSVRASER
jgi:serine/threonine protein kinase